MKKIIYIFSLAMALMPFNKINATDYYTKSTGAITTFSTWGINTNGTGTAPTGFSSAFDVWHFANRTSFTLGSPFNTNVSAFVVIESGVNVITNGIPPGLRIVSFLNIASTGSLTISRADVAYKYNSLDPNSTVIFNHLSAFIRPAYYGNIVVAVSTKLDAPSGGDIACLGTLTINSGRVLTLNSLGILLYGTTTFAGTGTITGDNTGAFLALYGGNGGNSGTLSFTSGSSILSGLFIFAPDVNSFFNLGSNLSIQGTGSFWQSLGGFNLNGFSLTVDATSDASFAADNISGGIMGNANSSLILNGTIGVNSGLSDLYMDATANTLKVLSVNSVSSLNFANTLNITDSLDVTNATVTTSGNLTLKSTNALKARVSEIKGTGSITGNINVETFIKGGFAAWTGIAPSGINGLSVTNWDGGSGSSTAFAMSCNGCINDEFSAGGTYFVSIQGDPLGNGVYTDLIASDPLTPGVGYWAFIGSSLTNAVDITQTLAGPIVTGVVTTPATSFVSNPYPSPISVDRMQATNPTMGTVYVWDGDAGAYLTYNAGVGGLPNGAIAMGQSFYIDGSGVSFQESHKVARNTSANYLMKTASNNIGTVFQLQVNGTNSDIDKMYVRLHQDATTNYDANLDAYKKFATPGYVGYPGPYNVYTSISSKLNNIDYSINSLPLLTTTNLVLPVLVKVMTTGSYTISPIDIANLPPNVCVTLHDKLLNTNHDLRTGSYVCTINDSTSTPRFELTICTNNIATDVNNLVSNENNTLISQDINGVFVKTNFEKSTKATITAYNVMGQKIMTDKEIEGTELTVYLDELNIHNQVIIIRVTSATKNTTQKVFVN